MSHTTTEFVRLSQELLERVEKDGRFRRLLAVDPGAAVKPHLVKFDPVFAKVPTEDITRRIKNYRAIMDKVFETHEEPGERVGILVGLVVEYLVEKALEYIVEKLKGNLPTH